MTPVAVRPFRWMNNRLKRALSALGPTAWVLVALAVTTAVVYAPVRHFAFVSIDDPLYVYENPVVAGGLSARAVAWAFTTGHAANWHPLTWLSHMLDVQLFGMHAGAHHVTSLLLHILNALLLFLVLRRMTTRVGPSALVAALFALHPLHVESVAWIAERKDVLSTFFFMLTLVAYTRYTRLAGAPLDSRRSLEARPVVSRAKGPAYKAYAAVLCCFALGLMAKSMLVTLPFVLLMLDVWPLGRLGSPKVRKSESPKVEREPRNDVAGRGFSLASLNRPEVRPSRRPDVAAAPGDHARRSPRSPIPDPDKRLVWPLVLEKLPLFALAAASTLITFDVQRTGGAVSRLTVIPIGRRLANALVAYATYILKMVWPGNLSVFYRYPESVPAAKVVLSALALAIVSLLVVRSWRRRPYLAVGWLWYLVTLAPVIGIIQIGRQSMADRYTYVPLIGLFIMVAWGIWEGGMGGREGAARLRSPNILGSYGEATPELRARTAQRRRAGWGGARRQPDVIVAVAAVAVVAACAVTTRAQVAYWENSTTLWEHALAVDSGNYFAHNSLGSIAADAGRTAEALAHFKQAVRFAPDYPEAYNNIGLVYAREGRAAEAAVQYRKALALNPSLAEAHDNLGVALATQGRHAAAVEEYEAAIRLTPRAALFRDNFGKALAALGRIDEAVLQYREALRWDPRLASAHANLGKALASQGKTDEAVTHYLEALQLNPNLVDAHNNLGVALVAQGKPKEAATHYADALRLQPDQPDVHSNLGVALASLGDRDEAVAHCVAAIRLKPDVAVYRYNLGFVLSGQGRTAEAIGAFSEALRLQPTLAPAHTSLALALAAQHRLADALPHFAEAARLQPGSDTAHQYLGLALAGAGRLADAIAELDEALRLNPGNQAARQARDMARQRLAPRTRRP